MADTPVTELFARRSNLRDAHERTALVTSGKDFFQVIVEKNTILLKFNFKISLVTRFMLNIARLQTGLRSCFLRVHDIQSTLCVSHSQQPLKF